MLVKIPLFATMAPPKTNRKTNRGTPAPELLGFKPIAATRDVKGDEDEPVTKPVTAFDNAYRVPLSVWFMIVQCLSDPDGCQDHNCKFDHPIGEERQKKRMAAHAKVLAAKKQAEAKAHALSAQQRAQKEAKESGAPVRLGWGHVPKIKPTSISGFPVYSPKKTQPKPLPVTQKGVMATATNRLAATAPAPAPAHVKPPCKHDGQGFGAGHPCRSGPCVHPHPLDDAAKARDDAKAAKAVKTQPKRVSPPANPFELLAHRA